MNSMKRRILAVAILLGLATADGHTQEASPVFENTVGVVSVSAMTGGKQYLLSGNAHINYWSKDATGYFFGKYEEGRPAGTLRYRTLHAKAEDATIIEELGGTTKAETTLIEMFALLSVQAKGEGEPFLTNMPNIFYIRDKKGELRAVCLMRGADGWELSAGPVGKGSWAFGSRVFVRVPSVGTEASAQP